MGISAAQSSQIQAVCIKNCKMKSVQLKLYLAVTEGSTNDGIVTNSQTSNIVFISLS